MTDATVELDSINFAGDDNVVPFQVDELDVRGRAVQIGPLLNTILGRHNYPPVVARLLAEAITLTALIGTSLKFSGRLTIQTKSDGPVDLVVADFSAPQNIRAYARFDEERVKEAIEKQETSPEQLLGSGILAFTIDQGVGMQPYQGIVALDGSSLEDIAGVYFRQSEQLLSRVRLGVAEFIDRDDEGKARHCWRAGGVIAQYLPQSQDRARNLDIHGGDGDDRDLERSVEELWEEAVVLLNTVQPVELTDPDVPSERLLYRLFHERGVRIYEPQAIVDQCSCSRDKLKGVLSGFSAEEIVDCSVDGKIAVSCEFCSTTYTYEPAELKSE